VRAHAPDGPVAIGSAVERAVLELGGGRSHDDMALLIVGVGRAEVAPPAATDRTFARRLSADVESVRIARTGVREWLEAHRLVPDRADDLLVAITELATNAVRAARTAMEVRAWATPEAVFVEVTDDGAGFDPSIPHTARELDPLAERGRGLFLVASLADECTIESGPNGTIVRCAVGR
jgi:anti-sigma regulatory factor (Ser/Thr protein kinase)